MKKLCVFTLYSQKGASSQYRAFIFKNELENNFELKWYSFWNNNYITRYMHNKKKYFIHITVHYLISVLKRYYQLKFIASKNDIIFLQKASIPKLKKTYLNKIKKKGIRIIFDVDDAIYLNSNDNSEEIAKISDTVICGNSNLKEHYSKYNNHCVLLPTTDNTYKYKPYWSNTFDSKIIGWIGSKTTIDNFDLIINSLNQIVLKHPEIRIAIVSNTPLDYTKRIKNSYFIKWNENTYVEEISKFTIGIMPLKSNEFNQGKCGFKLIQYLNMKKPVIGSNVGINSKIISGNGIIANTETEWISAFEQILFNKDYYDKCCSNIETVFLNDYHFEIISKRLLNILNNEWESEM